MEVSFYDRIKYNYEEYTVCEKGVMDLAIYIFCRFVDIWL